MVDDAIVGLLVLFAAFFVVASCRQRIRASRDALHEAFEKTKKDLQAIVDAGGQIHPDAAKNWAAHGILPCKEEKDA